MSLRHFSLGLLVAALRRPLFLAAPFAAPLAVAPLFALLFLAGCQMPGPTIRTMAPTETVAGLLVGSYSSADQAKEDKDFREITLHMARIWPTRTDGPWIYVEQALASEPLRPYRQRVYQVAACENPDATPGTIESRVFELPGDPLAFAGAWSDPTRFKDLTPEQLTSRDGCTVYLIPNTDGTWSGGTDGTSCSSALRGASYATSEVTLSGTELRSWDRGFDKAGKQVWGAEKGGYIFKRIVPESEAKKPTSLFGPTNQPATTQGAAKEVPKPIGIR